MVLIKRLWKGFSFQVRKVLAYDQDSYGTIYKLNYN